MACSSFKELHVFLFFAVRFLGRVGRVVFVVCTLLYIVRCLKRVLGSGFLC